MVTWASDGQDSSGYSIQGQLLTGNFVKIGREFRVNHYIYDNQQSPTLTELSDGNVAVIWESRTQDGSGYGIYGRILTPDITLFGYNFDIPKIYTEDTIYQFNDLVINPMVDADTVNATLTLSDPAVGNLSIESFNNITSAYDALRGIWRFAGGIVDVNKILNQLKF